MVGKIATEGKDAFAEKVIPAFQHLDIKLVFQMNEIQIGDGFIGRSKGNRQKLGKVFFGFAAKTFSDVGCNRKRGASKLVSEREILV